MPKKKADGPSAVVTAIPDASDFPPGCPPLLTLWLEREAAERGIRLLDMSKEHLGVSYSYIHQLKTGAREMANVSPEFLERCAKFLHLPHIVLRLAAGHITPKDFQMPDETETERVERAMRRLQAHPRGRSLLKVDPSKLPLEVQRGLLDSFSEALGEDLYAAPDLPAMLADLLTGALLFAKASPKLNKASLAKAA